jgi:c-type cytochrome biogenesis protein CcmF
MAALFSGRLGEEWIKVTQRWTIFAWLCLTTGILLGGYWAYYELGWGGYWGWDPVENASFMPWLVGTAYLHSVMVQEKRKMFKVWNLFLIIVTFSLSLIGTFLVRSGVLTSVHTFATDPERGVYILLFVAMVIGVAFGTLMIQSNKLKSQIEMDSLVSRESIFLFNNLFFLVAAATVFLGTLYPLMIETLNGSKVTVGPPYYNAVFMPIALGLLFLMGVGPYIPWRKASVASLKKSFLIPVIVGLASVGILFISGIYSLYALAGGFVVGFSASAIFMDFGKISRLYARREHVNVFKGLSRAFSANQRRYSSLITHLGALVLVVGIIASTIYQSEKVVSMKVGDEFSISDYQMKLLNIHEVEGQNWKAQEGVFEVTRGGDFITELRPQKRIYEATQTPTTESAIYAINMGHIFLTMPDSLGVGWRWDYGIGSFAQHFPTKKEGRMSRSTQITLMVCLLGLFALFYQGLWGDPRSIPTVLIGTTAPTFTGPDVESGKPISLDQYKGKVVLLNFWASWCRECKVEHDNILRLHEQFKDNPNFVMLGINYQDTLPLAQEYLKTYGSSFRHVRDIKGTLAIDYGVYGVPETFVIDQQGLIKHKWVGPLVGQVYTNLIERVLTPLLNNSQPSTL